MRKQIFILLLIFPAVVNAQIDTTLIKLLRAKPSIFIDSSILRRQDYDLGPFELFQGIWRTKDVNSSRIYSIAEYANGKIHGHYLDLSPNGGITQSLYYYHGVLNGPWIALWENGNLQTTGHYSNGKLEAVLRRFDTSGNLIYMVGHTNGKREGPEIRFYSSGNIKLITNYSGDWENGVRKEYADTPGNTLKGEFEMKNGLPVTGKFFENGVLKRTKNYDYEGQLKEREASKNKVGDHYVKELLSD